MGTGRGLAITVSMILVPPNPRRFILTAMFLSSVDPHVVGLSRRFLCMVTDWGVVLVLWIMAQLPFYDIDLSQASAGTLHSMQAYLLGVAILYFVVCWHRRHATLGMATWGIFVVDQYGQPIRWRAAIIRVLGALLSLACLGLGFWSSLLRPDRQCWHDRWSATHLVWRTGVDK